MKSDILISSHMSEGSPCRLVCKISHFWNLLGQCLLRPCGCLSLGMNDPVPSTWVTRAGRSPQLCLCYFPKTC